MYNNVVKDFTAICYCKGGIVGQYCGEDKVNHKIESDDNQKWGLDFVPSLSFCSIKLSFSTAIPLFFIHNMMISKEDKICKNSKH